MRQWRHICPYIIAAKFRDKKACSGRTYQGDRLCVDCDFGCQSTASGQPPDVVMDISSNRLARGCAIASEVLHGS